MRRNKDDKRVLRSGNGRQNTSKRRCIGRDDSRKLKDRHFISRNQTNNRHFMYGNQHKNKVKKKRKTSGFLVLIMVIALVSFVIGAGIGVSLSFEDNTEPPHIENVTEEMTTGLNNTENVSFDKEVDGIDYDENSSSNQSNIYTDYYLQE